MSLFGPQMPEQPEGFKVTYHPQEPEMLSEERLKEIMRVNESMRQAIHQLDESEILCLVEKASKAALELEAENADLRRQLAEEREAWERCAAAIESFEFRSLALRKVLAQAIRNRSKPAAAAPGTPEVKT